VHPTPLYKPLRKNLGKKNCELGREDIRSIVDTFLDFQEDEHSKVFPNAAFGYQKVTVERPLRLRTDLSRAVLFQFREACKERGEEPLAGVADAVASILGPGPQLDYNAFLDAAEREAGGQGLRLTAARKKLLREALTRRDEAAAPVLKKLHKPGKADPLHGLHETYLDGEPCVAEYEPDPELRDNEEVPLLEEGGIGVFFQREVLPHTPDAWIDATKTRTGYEINFNRHFYKPEPLRPLEEIRADIDALERETEGLLEQILVETEDG
jgi:type I restriction enzyme M protein